MGGSRSKASVDNPLVDNILAYNIDVDPEVGFDFIRVEDQRMLYIHMPVTFPSTGIAIIVPFELYTEDDKRIEPYPMTIKNMSFNAYERKEGSFKVKAPS